jgi:DNA invertase Pin-like site-specific DNA recombinase
MHAAIYARKSTDQSTVAEEQRSISRQIEHARAFAARNGWIVDDAHVFVDDGISGAEFSARPGFVRLLNAVRPRASFQVLIVSELSRLGREQLETGYALKQLSQAGVRIWSYLEGREILLDTPTSKFLMSAVSFAAEMEREKARQRVTDAMVRRAQAGHVTGGRAVAHMSSAASMRSKPPCSGEFSTSVPTDMGSRP